MRRILLAFSPLFWAASAWAQSGIEVPDIGTIVDASGILRRVQGVAGNFRLGPAIASEVLSAACSERVCLAKTDSKVLSTTGEVEAPPGPAIFGFDAAEAIVYFPGPRTFARWHDNILDPLECPVDGEVLALRVRGGETEIAVRRDRRVWRVHQDGSVMDWIAETAGPVLLLREGVLFATPDELILRRRDAREVRFALAGAETMTAMGSLYIAIRAGGTTYALRMEPGNERLFLLPGSVP